MRFFEAYIPMIKPSSEITSWPDQHDLKKEHIKQEYQHQLLKEKYHRDNNIKPRFVRDTIYFVSKTDFDNLDFYGRVSEKSTKNFQLSDAVNSDKIFLQFGRAGE